MKKEDYSELVKKKDWEKSREQFEGLYVNSAINAELYALCVKRSEERIAELPDEVDEIVDEVTKDD